MLPWLTLMTGMTLVSGTDQRVAEYLSDSLHRILYLQQGWGELGLDTCAHARGSEPLPLQIGDRRYDKGLGHHAPGEMVVELNGEFEAFEAWVGLQWQQGATGSVVFQVWVDGEQRFDSGVLREADAPRPVRVPLQGALEMRLVVTDAGDGITCDCADWAEARLIRSASPVVLPREPSLDVAPFARVVACDPHRADGARASRIQPFRAEDLFLETDVPLHAEGACAVPISPDGTGCIGLRWIERRRLRSLALRFASPAPAPETVRLEYWAGESPWQGGWRPLPADLEVEGERWVFTVQGDREHADLFRQGTWKVRWVFPESGAGAMIWRPEAYTRSRWETAELALEMAEAGNGEGVVEVYNGAVVRPETKGTSLQWDLRRPLRLTVRHSRPGHSRTDRTVLRLRLPGHAFGVAVDDVLEHGEVWIPHAGLRVKAEGGRRKAESTPGPRTSDLSTILDRVRALPDQTFRQALARTHRAAQDEGPMMLSLACDNRKWIVQRQGAIEFEGFRLTPRLGAGESASFSRHLHGGWLPAPVIGVEEGGVRYQQMTFVCPTASKAESGKRKAETAAVDDVASSPIAHRSSFDGHRPLCVAEWTMRNPQPAPAPATLRLQWASHDEATAPLDIQREGDRFLVTCGGRLLACVETAGAGPLQASLEGNDIVLQGALPARETARCIVHLPGWRMEPDDHQALHGSSGLLSDLKSYWEEALAPAMQVELPDPFLSNVIRASQVHCLIAARNEDEGERVAAWIASMSYGPLESEAHSVVRGMDLMGHEEFARRALDFFVHRYAEEGYLTTGYTLMGTGWHLWKIGEHYRLTADRAWLERIAPEVARVCRWVVQQRAKTMKTDAAGSPVPEYGLMPPGVMADWNSFACYFALNGYYHAGLSSAARALADIGHPDAPALLAEADRFRADIERAYRWTQARMPVVPLQDGSWVPGYPSQLHTPGPSADFFPGEDGNRSWAYDVEIGAHQLVPHGVLPADGPDSRWMLDHMEDVHFLSDGWFDYPGEESRADWFNLGGFAKVQPYYCRNGEVYALRDDVKPFLRTYFNALCSLLNTENLSLWEHFHHSGAWNKTHETGYFLQQTRFMLVMERGDELWLAPLITDRWLKDGLRIEVRNAPTRCGPVSYRIESHVGRGFIDAVIEPPARTPPKAIVVRLRHPGGRRMQSVTLNGEPWEGFDAEAACVRIGSLSEMVRLRVHYQR